MVESGLSSADFILFRELINNHSGIWLSDQKKNFLMIRLVHRMESCKVATFKEYYYYLKYDPRGGEELQNLIDAVTINETHFFREASHFRVFRDRILKQVVDERRKAGERYLKLWSAACSTGEEAYTIAMMVLDVIKGTAMWGVEILATDISNTALESARRGVYESYTLRETEPYYLKEYFDQVSPGRYRVKEQLKKLVHFGWINLVDGAATRKIANMDCIFCRNVIMYLDMENRRRVLANMYRSLAPGGYLFLGEAESLRGLAPLFELRHFDKSIIYQKPGKEIFLREAV